MSSKVAGTFRQIHTRIWDDPWFQDLLPEEKLLFIYLFSNERAALCGLYELSLKTMAFETGLRKDAITLALHRFGLAGKAFWDGRHVWVPNLRKYNETASEKVQIRIAKELAAIPDCELKRRYVAGDTTPLDVAASAEDGVSIPYPQLRSEKEKEKEYEPENKAKRARPAAGAPPKAHPAIAIFREETRRYPKAGPVQDEIRNLVGHRQDELDLWRRIVHEWVTLGWNPANVRGMLDCFTRQEVPGRKGKQTEPKGFAAVRQAAAELEARDG